MGSSIFTKSSQPASNGSDVCKDPSLSWVSSLDLAAPLVLIIVTTPVIKGDSTFS